MVKIIKLTLSQSTPHTHSNRKRSLGERRATSFPAALRDIAYRLRENNWNGNTTVSGAIGSAIANSVNSFFSPHPLRN